ncbi:MAG: transposase zinc-binding domain-containing protein, partial [Lachnospiraceae bacterium]|nr:transposase zinc-binding domain-containing protein [Lachnospiraceae bacterium]
MKLKSEKCKKKEGKTALILLHAGNQLDCSKQVFTAKNYEEMIYILHPRQAVVENVEKMIHCGDPSFGGAMYGCPSCGTL